jgi:hypothetical protein
MKVCPLGAEVFHVDRGTQDGEADLTELINAFRNFTSPPQRQACGFETHSEVVSVLADRCNVLQCQFSERSVVVNRKQFRQWFKSPGYGFSARALTPYRGDLTHCRNCTPASEDGLK